MCKYNTSAKFVAELLDHPVYVEYREVWLYHVIVAGMVECGIIFHI